MTGEDYNPDEDDQRRFGEISGIQGVRSKNNSKETRLTQKSPN
jgi:hypothetical protein